MLSESIPDSAETFSKHFLVFQSLGCVLYEMAFLRSPFVWTSSEQGGSIALAVLGRHLKYPDVIAYSHGLVDFIEFMLQVHSNNSINIFFFLFFKLILNYFRIAIDISSQFVSQL